MRNELARGFDSWARFVVDSTETDGVVRRRMAEGRVEEKRWVSFGGPIDAQLRSRNA